MKAWNVEILILDSIHAGFPYVWPTVGDSELGSLPQKPNLYTISILILFKCYVRSYHFSVLKTLMASKITQQNLWSLHLGPQASPELSSSNLHCPPSWAYSNWPNAKPASTSGFALFPYPPHHLAGFLSIQVSAQMSPSQMSPSLTSSKSSVTFYLLAWLYYS